ncbi:MAG TPA: MBL fold metallo-hydrolase [Gemmatimonadaceae bacterium]
MALSVRFWGTRGSIPSPGPETARHGGNTPCLELRTAEGWLVILDAGTGIRELGRRLVAEAAAPDGGPGGSIQGDIFLSHAHWDHIQGIPFFAPIFGRGHHFTIWGSSALEGSVERVVRDQMSPVVFPVTFEELDATIDFCQLGEERREGRGYAVQAFQVRHPGGALGYRFSPRGDGDAGAGGALVYIPDNELGDGGRYDAPDDWRERLVAFTRGASVLVHDTMYTAEEYRRHGGWGHSTYDDAVQLALDAGVERLVLFHHKPERGDAELDARVAECRARVARDGRPLEVIAAAEGMQLTV